MNAKTFFSERDFVNMKSDFEGNKIVSITDTPYCRFLNVNGNKYKIFISFTENQYFGYHPTVWVDYNFADSRPDFGRNIGGGNYGDVKFTTYTEFCETLNKAMEWFPDFEIEAQMSMF